jgi:peptidoglycan/LPS O-acetylase OafA/YrhL
MRVLYFDFLRVAAIAAIYFYHLFDFTAGGARVTNMIERGLVQSVFGRAEVFSDYLWGLCQLLFALGNRGVELFVIASGFGLYMGYLSRRTPWREFFIKRVLRVLPLYWAAVLAIYLLFHAPARHLLQNLLLVQTFTREPTSMGPMWFIAYLFHLYILFPLIVRVFENRYAKWALFGASFILTPLLQAAIRAAGHEPFGILPTTYLPLFLLGMLVAESYHEEGSLHGWLLNPVTAAASILLLGALIYLVSYRIPFTDLAQRAMGVLMFCALYLPFLAVRGVRALRRPVELLAYSSYVVFLTHMIIFSQIIALRRASQGLARKTFIYVTAAGSPHEAVRFMVPALEILVIIFAASYALQLAYDWLLSRLRRPVPT